MEKVCYDFDGGVDLWSELECLKKRDGCSMFVPEEFLVKVGVSSVHCLLENKITWHCTHVLFNASTPMSLTILPGKQNKNAINFHRPLYKIKYMTNPLFYSS